MARCGLAVRIRSRRIHRLAGERGRAVESSPHEGLQIEGVALVPVVVTMPPAGKAQRPQRAVILDICSSAPGETPRLTANRAVAAIAGGTRVQALERVQADVFPGGFRRWRCRQRVISKCLERQQGTRLHEVAALHLDTSFKTLSKVMPVGSPARTGPGSVHQNPLISGTVSAHVATRPKVATLC